MRVNSVLVLKNDNFRGVNVSKNTFAPNFTGLNPKIFKELVLEESKSTSAKLHSVRAFLTKGLDLLEASPVRKNFNGYSIPINNRELLPYIKESYSSASLKKLYRKAKNGGAFDYKVDEKNGFIKTSDFIPKTYEEQKMVNLVWVTDSCRNMEMLEKDRPDLCTKALESLSTFYKHQQGEFDDVINNPAIYNSHNGWGKGGVFHEFNSETFEPNTDFPRTRLESMGQYLKKASQYIVGGLEKGKEYGYKTADEVSDNTIDSISNCVKYLSSINYPHARSCGAWEEHTFDSSITSDTAIINDGFGRILNFMYEDSKNSQSIKIKKRILNSKYGRIFFDKEKLTNLLKDGEQRVISNHLEEAPWQRQLDAAMSFVTHNEKARLVPENMELSPSQNVIADINENVKLLLKLEGNTEQKGLVGEYGMKRYLGDEYKNLNYDIPARQSLLKENHEAQWFLISEMSTGYGIQLKKLLKVIKKEQRLPNEEEKVHIRFLLAKETEYTNRTYARDTGKNKLKANGQPCPNNKFSEAYQAITDLFTKKVEFKPGTNTPLAQAQASALIATRVHYQNLKALEGMGFNSQI